MNIETREMYLPERDLTIGAHYASDGREMLFVRYRCYDKRQKKKALLELVKGLDARNIGLSQLVRLYLPVNPLISEKNRLSLSGDSNGSRDGRPEPA